MSWTPHHNEVVYKDSLESIVDAIGGTGIVSGMAVTPGSGSYYINIASGTYKINGTKYSYAGVTNFTLGPYIPNTTNYYQYVLVSVNSSGSIVVSESTEASATSDLVMDYTSSSGNCKVATIQLRNGQTTIDSAEILDSARMVIAQEIDLANDVTGILPSANMDADTAHLSGTQTFTGSKTFSSNVTIDVSDDSATANPKLVLTRSMSTVPNDGDDIGLIEFRAPTEQSASQELLYASIGAEIVEGSNSNANPGNFNVARLLFNVQKHQSTTAEEILSLTGATSSNAAIADFNSAFIQNATLSTGTTWNGNAIGDTYLGGLALRKTMSGSDSIDHYGYRLRLGGSSPNYVPYGIVLSQFDNGGYTLHMEYTANYFGQFVIGYKNGTSNFGTWDYSDVDEKHFIFDRTSVYSESIRDATTSSSANFRIDTTTGLLRRSTSSQRYKTNLQDIPYDRTAFHNVTPRLFESTIEREEGFQRWGLIAEDLQTAFGDTIIDFNDNEEVENYDTRGIIAVMYQEIKNLKAEIDELKNNNGG